VQHRKVAIITGASRGIGAGLADGYRKQGWAVVASARTIRPSPDPFLLAVAADITEPATASRRCMRHEACSLPAFMQVRGLTSWLPR